jgi:lipopolysaccharide export system protein LptA
MRTKMALILAALLGTASASAAPEGPFAGLGDDSDKPITYSAETQQADFEAETITLSGNVRIQQGDMLLRAATVTVRAPGGRIVEALANGDVIVTSKDATARAPEGVYDVTARAIRLTGGVVLTQGENTLKGSALTVDLKAGTATLTSDGRVEGVLQPGGAQ